MENNENVSTPYFLKRVYKFILKRSLGRFLKYEIELDQLDVFLSQGHLILRDLVLNCDVLNDLIVDIPFEFCNVYIGELKTTIPWKSIWSENSVVNINSLVVTIKAKDSRGSHSFPFTGASTANDVISSVFLGELKEVISDSMNINNLKKNKIQSDEVTEEPLTLALDDNKILSDSEPESSEEEEEESFAINDGMSVLSKLIERILLKMQVSLMNTTLRVIYEEKISNSNEKVKQSVLLLRIPFFEYKDESSLSIVNSDNEQRKVFTVKGIQLQLYDREINIEESFARSDSPLPFSDDDTDEVFELNSDDDNNSNESNTLVSSSGFLDEESREILQLKELEKNAPTILMFNSVEEDLFTLHFKLPVENIDSSFSAKVLSSGDFDLSCDLFIRNVQIRMNPNQLYTILEIVNEFKFANDIFQRNSTEEKINIQKEQMSISHFDLSSSSMNNSAFFEAGSRSIRRDKELIQLTTRMITRDKNKIKNILSEEKTWGFRVPNSGYSESSVQLTLINKKTGKAIPCSIKRNSVGVKSSFFDIVPNKVPNPGKYSLFLNDLDGHVLPGSPFNIAIKEKDTLSSSMIDTEKKKVGEKDHFLFQIKAQLLQCTVSLLFENKDEKVPFFCDSIMKFPGEEDTNDSTTSIDPINNLVFPDGTEPFPLVTSNHITFYINHFSVQITNNSRFELSIKKFGIMEHLVNISDPISNQFLNCNGLKGALIFNKRENMPNKFTIQTEPIELNVDYRLLEKINGMISSLEPVFRKYSGDELDTEKINIKKNESTFERKIENSTKSTIIDLTCNSLSLICKFPVLPAVASQAGWKNTGNYNYPTREDYIEAKLDDIRVTVVLSESSRFRTKVSIDYETLKVYLQPLGSCIINILKKIDNSETPNIEILTNALPSKINTSDIKSKEVPKVKSMIQESLIIPEKEKFKTKVVETSNNCVYLTIPSINCTLTKEELIKFYYLLNSFSNLETANVIDRSLEHEDLFYFQNVRNVVVDSDKTNSLALSLIISNLYIDLIENRNNNKDSSPIFSIKISDIYSFLVSQYHEESLSYFIIEASKVSLSSFNKRLISINPGLSFNNGQESLYPLVLNLMINSSYSNINILCLEIFSYGLLVDFDGDLDWATKLGEFFNIPIEEGLDLELLPKVFFDFSTKIDHFSLDCLLPKMEEKMIFCFDSLTLSSNIIAMSPSTLLTFSISDVRLFLSDNRNDLNDFEFIKTTHKYLKSLWRDIGLTKVAHMDLIEGKVFITNPGPVVNIDLNNQLIVINLCSDSAHTLRILSENLINVFGETFIEDDIKITVGENEKLKVAKFLKEAEIDIPESEFNLNQMDQTRIFDKNEIVVLDNYSPYPKEELSDSFGSRGSNSNTSIGSINSFNDETLEESLDNVYEKTSNLAVTMTLDASQAKRGVVELEELMNEMDDLPVDFSEDSDEEEFNSMKISSNTKDSDIKITILDKEENNNENNNEFNMGKHIISNYIWLPSKNEFEDIEGEAFQSSKYPESKLVFRFRCSDFRMRLFSGYDFGKKSLKEPRITDNFMELRLFGISLLYHDFGDAKERYSSYLFFKVKDITLMDFIQTSNWHKSLCYYRGSETPSTKRLDNDDQISIQIESIRPDINDKQEELKILVSILPIRLNVDQDALDFLISFIATALGTNISVDSNVDRNNSNTAKNTSRFYIQSLEIRPLRIGIDYKPKRFNYESLQAGNYAELMNILPLEGLDIILRRIFLSGISDFEEIINSVIDIWLPDIIRTQLHKCIGGVKPIHSIVSMGTGVADLILLPIEQYRRDGRILRGIRRGASSFLKSLALETLHIGTRLAVGTTTAVDMLLGSDDAENSIKSSQNTEISSSPSSYDEDDLSGSVLWTGMNVGSLPSQYADQPETAKDGIIQAYSKVFDGFKQAGKTIISIPMTEYEKNGSGKIRKVIKAVPVAILGPTRGLVSGLASLGLGAQNQIDPRRYDDQFDKYRPRKSSTHKRHGD